ncbi:hypothetical protein Rsub_07424 [Raphidocelis subcapitata]|uniref:Uncharacterized protein n=1 Tax=Raphidocelis subcapitata TaxID=307507 RepID=A0A2V0P4A2_9CHLO|nr:hypothetical protein Rsub_07424 [Raphidocelis subcapitata]|eukprot:GBF94688.1 hypothetical protein Rsub_07424 [Raphidocelis subcapitata]
MTDWFVAAACGAALLGTARIAAAQLGEWRQRRAAARRRRARAGGGAGAPLRRVVAACEARWFLDELKLAVEGDSEAMVRVGHMLLSGYGVRQDRGEAARWLRAAWAIQNFKEPAVLEMLDPDESAVPALNMQQPKAGTSASRDDAGAAAAPPPQQQQQQQPEQQQAVRRRLRRQRQEAESAQHAAGGGAGEPGSSGSGTAIEPPPVQLLYASLGYSGPPAPSPEEARARARAAAAADPGAPAGWQAAGARGWPPPLEQRRGAAG